MVGRTEGGQFVFLDLATGAERARVAAPGDWTRDALERPRGTNRPGAPLVFEADDRSFFVVAGAAPVVDRVHVPFEIDSKNLHCVGGVVPFMTKDRQLAVWSSAEREAVVLGPLNHGMRDLIPFCEGPGGSFVAGTSSGQLVVFPSRGSGASRRRTFDRRITTDLAFVKGLVVCGTQGGRVVGIDVLASPGVD